MCGGLASGWIDVWVNWLVMLTVPAHVVRTQGLVQAGIETRLLFRVRVRFKASVSARLRVGLRFRASTRARLRVGVRVRVGSG